MITFQDIQYMPVAKLRKEAQQRGIDTIQSDERGEIKPRIARKSELIKALKPHCEPKAKELTVDMFHLTDDEQKIVEEALAISGLNLLELAKSGLLMKARRITTDLNKVQSLSPEERRNTTLKGAAQANLRDTVDRIIAWNNACYDNKLRVFINASILRNLTGSNLNTIKEFLPTYRSSDEESIEEHNSRHKLFENDNRKGRDEFGHKIRISELIKQPLPLPATPKEVEQSFSPEKPKIEETKKPSPIFPQESPEEFAEAIAQLENEGEILEACKAQMEVLVERNGSKSFASFKKIVTPFRSAVAAVKLTPHNLYTHEYGSPRTLKEDEQVPKGAQFNEQGKVISEPRHLALKFLSPDLYKGRFSE